MKEQVFRRSLEQDANMTPYTYIFTYPYQYWPAIDPKSIVLMKLLDLKPPSDFISFALYKNATCDYLDTYCGKEWRKSTIDHASLRSYLSASVKSAVVLSCAIYAQNVFLIDELFDQSDVYILLQPIRCNLLLKVYAKCNRSTKCQYSSNKLVAISESDEIRSALLNK